MVITAAGGPAATICRQWCCSKHRGSDSRRLRCGFWFGEAFSDYVQSIFSEIQRGQFLLAKPLDLSGIAGGGEVSGNPAARKIDQDILILNALVAAKAFEENADYDNECRTGKNGVAMAEISEQANETNTDGTALPAGMERLTAQETGSPVQEQPAVSAVGSRAAAPQSNKIAKDKTSARTLARAQEVAEKLSTATEQVASAINEATTTVAELGKSIETIAFGAEELGKSMQAIVSGAEDAVEAAGESRAAIDQIEKASDQANAQATEMERLAFLDPVTRLPNRRYVETSLHTTLDQFHTDKEIFGVLLIDLDRFKAINDELGHINGDRALREVGKILSGELRSMDIVGRWGGDEFIAIIHHVDHKILRELADRCCAMVARTMIPNSAGAPVPLSVSIGGTLALPDDVSEKLIERADRLMYECKTSGRGRASIDGTNPAAETAMKCSV